MSWIRVECSGGARYHAPSFNPPPTLEGFDRLFSSEAVALRGIQCFPVCQREGGGSEGDGTTETVNVLFGSFPLGGRLGTATVAVGAPTSEGTPCLLRRLLRYTEEVLRSTSDAGARLLLDAASTRDALPWPTRGEADGLVEGDGRRGALERWGERGALKNRDFLCRVQPSFRPASADVRGGTAPLRPYAAAASRTLSPWAASAASGDAAASLRPSSPRWTAEVRDGEGLLAAALRPLSLADSRRRRALLHFTRLDAVPVSLLFSRTAASWEAVDPDGKWPKEKSTGTRQSRSPCQQSLSSAIPPAWATAEAAPAHSFPLSGPSPSVSYSATATSCLSDASFQKKMGSHGEHDERDGGVHRYWQLYPLAVSGCTTALQHTMRRILQAAFPTAYGHLFEYAMWESDAAAAKPPAPVELAGPSPTTTGLLAAAFSPSGLAVASPAFFTALSHKDRLKLSAAAVDAMSRGGTTSAASLLQVRQFPLMVTTPAAVTPGTPPCGTTVMDMCTMTVGDALCLVFGFARPTRATAETPAATAAAVPRIEPFMEYLSALSGAASHVAQSAPDMSLFASAAHVCTSSTQPTTAAFSQHLFAVSSRSREAFLSSVSREQHEHRRSVGDGHWRTRLQGRGGGNSAPSTSDGLSSTTASAATSTSSPLHPDGAAATAHAPPQPRYPQHAYRPPPPHRAGTAAAAGDANVGDNAETAVSAAASSPPGASQPPSPTPPRKLFPGEAAPQRQQANGGRRTTGELAARSAPRTVRASCLRTLPFCSSSPWWGCEDGQRNHPRRTGHNENGQAAAAAVHTPLPARSHAEVMTSPHLAVDTDDSPWGVRSVQHGHEGADGLAAAALTPSEEAFLSLCYVAVAVTHLELNAFRPLEHASVHAFFLVSAEFLPSENNGRPRGRYALSFFRPQLQRGGAPSSASRAGVHDATQLCSLFTTEERGGADATAATRTGPASTVLLLPLCTLDQAVPERDAFASSSAATATDNAGGPSLGSAASTDRDDDSDEEDGGPETLLTCLVSPTAHKMARGGSHEERAKRGARCGESEVLVALEGNYVDAAAALHGFLANASTRGASFSGDDFLAERKGELKQLCKQVTPCLQAAKAVLDGALAATA